MTDWKTQYEASADAEFVDFSARPLDELLAAIRSGQAGEYFQVWQAGADRGTAAQVGWTLFDVLVSDRPYLERYHCAGALLRVLGSVEFKPVQLSAAWPSRAENLMKLRQLLEAAAGPRPG